MSGLLAFAAAASMFGTSVEDLRREFPHSPYDNAIVADAIARLIAENGGRAEAAKSITENVIPIVVHFPDRRCVVLRWPAGSVGGTPIYCYRLERAVLLEYFPGGQ